MAKTSPPKPQGHDDLLRDQALETGNLRAARDERRALNDDLTPKRYRLGPENPDGTRAIDVADRGVENWHQREMCPDLATAEERLKQLRASVRENAETRMRAGHTRRASDSVWASPEEHGDGATASERSTPSARKRTKAEK